MTELITTNGSSLLPTTTELIGPDVYLKVDKFRLDSSLTIE